MTYTYPCECSYVIQIHTDTKPPKYMKCTRCKLDIPVKGYEEKEETITSEAKVEATSEPQKKKRGRPKKIKEAR